MSSPTFPAPLPGSVRWTVVVACLAVGLLLGPRPPTAAAAASPASLDDRVNLQRLRQVQEALGNLQAMVDNMETDMETQMFTSGARSRHPTWHVANTDQFERSDYDTELPNYRPITASPGEADDPAAEAEENAAERESMAKRSRATGSGYYTEDRLGNADVGGYSYSKRYVHSGFSAARGKRPSTTDEDTSYKRGPPQGFSSVRGKRHGGLSDFSDKRAPPNGFSSVRGKRPYQFNPFLRLFEAVSAQEPPKRVPPMGFSSVRGKRRAATAVGRLRIPRQDYYRYMVARLLTGR